MGGRIYIYCPEHPFSTRMGYVAESRLIMEEHIGRFLIPEEIVHHTNENFTDNRIENLQLMTNVKHSRIRALRFPSKGRYKKHVDVKEILGNEKISMMELCRRIMKRFNVCRTTARTKIDETKGLKIEKIGNWKKLVYIGD